MKFTRYVWDLYISSRQGKAALRKPISHWFPDVAQPWTFPLWRISRGHGLVLTDEPPWEGDIKDVIKAYRSPSTIRAGPDARDLFGTIVNGIAVRLDQSGPRRHVVLGGAGSEDEIIDEIEGLSLALYELLPNHFVPLFFRLEFDRLMGYCGRVRHSNPSAPW